MSDLPPGVDSHCVHSDGTAASQPWRSATVVVLALFREWQSNGTQWLPPHLLRQYPVYLYQRLSSHKPCYLRNRAFESGVYFSFIVQHWHALPAYMALVQADWFERIKNARPLQPFDFWQPRCARAARLDWLPIGKRRSRWPPAQVSRSASYWEGHALARGASGVGELVRRCWRDVLADFGRADEEVTNTSTELRFYPYNNLVVSRERLHAYPEAAWRAVHGRLMHTSSCLREPRNSGVTRGASGNGRPVADGGDFDKVHASALEVLQDALFGKWPVASGARHVEMPNQTACGGGAVT